MSDIELLTLQYLTCEDIIRGLLSVIITSIKITIRRMVRVCRCHNRQAAISPSIHLTGHSLPSSMMIIMIMMVMMIIIMTIIKQYMYEGINVPSLPMYDCCIAPMDCNGVLNSTQSLSVAVVIDGSGTIVSHDETCPGYPYHPHLLSAIILIVCNFCIHSLEQPGPFPPMVSVCMHLQSTEMRTNHCNASAVNL